MITIVAYDTSFAAAYNLRKAFSLWEETRLISLLAHERWPEDTDLILTDENARECRRLVEKSRFTMIAGASAVWAKMLEKLGGPRDWQKWARRQQWVPFFTDTPYFYEAVKYNQVMAELGVKTIFAMPDLMPMAPEGAVPLHQPTERVEPVPKAGKLTLMHSPQSRKKRLKKGSDRIEAVIGRLRADRLPFDYQTVTGLPYRECMALKNTAHIFIDQLPNPGLPAGMGRSGEEGLGLGCVVLSSMYPAGHVQNFFEYPPVWPVYDEEGLYQSLRGMMAGWTKEDLAAGMAASRAWAEKYLFFEPWLEYVERWLVL